MSRRRRKNPSLRDFDTLLMWGAVAVGAYILYKAYKGAGAVAGAISDATQSAGSWVADLFPTNIAQPGGSFTVTQKDGTQITVPYGWKAGDPIPRDDSSDIDLSTMNF